jgi:hypothetical protein
MKDGQETTTLVQRKCGWRTATSRCIQCGDVICVLYGCALPLVLRPQDDGTHKIVCVAYVDGMMSGEFLENAADYVDMDFVIN